MSAKKRESCIVCNGTNFRALRENGQAFTTEVVTMCLDCGLAFLDNYNIPENYYTQGDFDREIRNLKMAVVRSEQSAQWRVPFISPYLVGTKEYLEIGCGLGANVFLLANTFPNMATVGIDPSPVSVKLATEIGLNVFQDTFPTDRFGDKKFEAIGLFHVIEHIEHPVPFIREIASKLHYDGYFFVEHPDLEQAIIARGSLHEGYFQKSHLFDFSLYHMMTLCERAGLQYVDSFTGTGFPSDKNRLSIFQKKKVFESDSHSFMLKDRALNVLTEFKGW